MENFLGSGFNLKLEKTMKKYFVYIASAVLMMAACAKEDINTPVETPVVGETEFISIELNPATRTILDGTNTNWSAGDAVGVYFSDESIGTLTLVEGSTNKFEGEIESALLTGQDKITLKYPADVTAVPTTQVAVAGSFANGAALLEGLVKLKDLRAGEGVTLNNKTALLEFSVAKAGDVTFEVGSTKYTVTGCKTGNTYYACVAPASNVSFVARIGGYLSKKASSNKTFTVGKIADLGVLTEPETCKYGLIGAHQNWTWGQDKLTKLQKVDDNLYAVKNIKLQSNGFKFAKMTATGWDSGDPGKDANSYGVHGTSSGVDYYKYDTENNNKWYEFWTNNDIANKKHNIGVSNFSNTYDIYLYFEDKLADGYQHFKFTVVKSGTKMPN